MMTDVHRLYFNWLTERYGLTAEPGVVRMAHMLHTNVFQRRVGNDVNRANAGEALRRIFLDDWAEANIDPRTTNDFMAGACSWLEMLLALAESIDFTYDGGVDQRFVELCSNMGIFIVATRTNTRFDQIDQQLVDTMCNVVDFNQFDPDGRGGLFPLTKQDHPNQREVEIWDQQAAYFRERLEGVMWTSTQ
jgi:hypothetical protein